jgi:hypothetical protein
MTDCKAIAEAILDLPSDLSVPERDKQVIALCKGLDEDERIEVAEQGNRLLKERDPAWKRWEEAEYLVTFNPAEQYVGALLPEHLEPGEPFDPFGKIELELLRRIGNERAPRVLAVLALLEDEDIGA